MPRYIIVSAGISSIGLANLEARRTDAGKILELSGLEWRHDFRSRCDPSVWDVQVNRLVKLVSRGTIQIAKRAEEFRGV